MIEEGPNLIVVEIDPSLDFFMIEEADVVD